MLCYGVACYGVMCCYGVVWCVMVWCGVLWCAVMCYGVVWCAVMLCYVVVCCYGVWCGVKWQADIATSQSPDCLHSAQHTNSSHYICCHWLYTNTSLEWQQSPLRVSFCCGVLLRKPKHPLVCRKKAVHDTVYNSPTYFTLVSRLIQFTTSRQISKICVLKFFLSSSFQTRNCMHFSSVQCVPHEKPISHFFSRSRW